MSTYREIFNQTQDTVSTSEMRQRVFVVFDAFDKLSAINAVGIHYNDSYVNPQNPSDNDDTLKVSSILPIQTSYGQFRVVYEYTRPEQGATHIAPKPIDRIPTVKWDYGYTSLEVDCQQDLTPILNPVGDPYANLTQRQYRVSTFTVNYFTNTWSESTFSQYRNAVNDSDWDIGGMTVKAHMAWCTYFGIPYEIGSDVEVVKVTFQAQIWDGGLLRYPWQSRKAATAFNAWGQPSGGGSPVKGVITDKSGTPLQDEIAVTLTGMPVDSSAGYKVKVGAALYDICAAPSGTPQTWFDYDAYTVSGKTYYYLYYELYRTRDFNPLANILGLSTSGGDIVGG